MSKTQVHFPSLSNHRLTSYSEASASLPDGVDPGVSVRFKNSYENEQCCHCHGLDSHVLMKMHRIVMFIFVGPCETDNFTDAKPQKCHTTCSQMFITGGYVFFSFFLFLRFITCIVCVSTTKLKVWMFI